MHEVRVPLNTVHLGIETLALQLEDQVNDEEDPIVDLIKQTQLGISTMQCQHHT